MPHILRSSHHDNGSRGKFIWKSGIGTAGRRSGMVCIEIDHRFEASSSSGPVHIDRARVTQDQESVLAVAFDGA